MKMNQIEERIDVEEMRKLAAALGRKGGQSKSAKKRKAGAANLAAARAAGKVGGYPKGRPRKPKSE